MTGKKTTPTPKVTSVSAASYDGFYFRDNLAADGTVPAKSPYNECPDIIRSPSLVSDPSTTFGSIASWNTSYEVQPDTGATNYYYLRGANGAVSEVETDLSLYAAPAQLILFPGTWKNSPLKTTLDAETVPVSAKPGHIGVADTPFAWNAPPLPDHGSTFYSFVSATKEAQIPDIDSWEDMGTLMMKDLGFGTRNGVTVCPDDGSWTHRIGLNVPMSLGQSGEVVITLTATGLIGGTVALLVDQFTSDMKEISIQPIQVQQDGQTIGIMATLDPGFSATVAVQYWNTPPAAPADGSSLILTVNYKVPSNDLERVAQKNLLDMTYSNWLSQQLGVTPTAYVPLGSVTFLTVGS